MNKVIMFAIMVMSFQTQAVTVTSDKLAVSDSITSSGLANPDHRRVAGSAVILKTNGTIDDSTIPSIEQPADSIKENSIFDYLEPADIKLQETRIIE